MKTSHTLRPASVATITEEEWLSTLEALGAPADDAMTISGWADKMRGGPSTSWDRKRATDWIRVGLEQGWMERATTAVTSLAGVPRMVTGFRLVEKRRRKKG